MKAIIFDFDGVIHNTFELAYGIHKVVAVDFGYHERERLEKGNPFAIVSDFREIRRVAKELHQFVEK